MTLNLEAILAATIGLVALHAFVLLPATRKWVQRAEPGRKHAVATLLLILESTQLFATAALISAGLTWGVVRGLAATSGATADSVARTMEVIAKVRNFALLTEYSLAFLALVCSGAGLIWWIIRRRSAKLDAAKMASIQSQSSRLLEQFQEGSLPEMEPNDQMRHGFVELERLSAKTDELEALLAAHGEDFADERGQLETQLARVAERRQHVLEGIVKEDLTRRIVVPQFDPDLVATPPPPRNWRQRLGRVFVSRGMFQQLSIGQRGLLLLNVLLLIPSLLVFSGPSIAAELASKLARLDELRVSLVAQEADRSLAMARARVNAEKTDPSQTAAPSQPPNPETIRQAATLHARAFEYAAGRRLEKGLGLAPQTSQHALGAALKEQAARRAILQSASDAINGTTLSAGESAASRRVGVQLGQSPSDPFPHVADRLLVSSVDPEHPPLTPMGRRFAADAVELAERDPRFAARLVDSVKTAGASFSELARPSQLRAVFVAAAVGHGVETAALQSAVTAPIAEWAGDAFDRSARSMVYRSFAPNYLAKLMEGNDPATALKFVETMAQSPLLEAEVQVARSQLKPILQTDGALAAQIERLTPGLVETRDNLVNEALRDETLRAYYARAAKQQNVAVNIERLVSNAAVSSSFETYFPNAVGDAVGALGSGPSTEPHRSGGGGGGSAGFGGSSGRPKPSAVAANRARNFVALRGFSRVGGVVIGRDADKQDPLDIRALSWTLEGKRLRLTLTDDKGHETTLGPFSPSAVNLALSYAADGRVLTATMTKAEPLDDLRILLHPVLVDTGLGCRAIEIDRFVDEMASAFPAQANQRQNLTLIVSLQREFYALARAELITAAFASEPKLIADLLKVDKAILDSAKASASDPVTKLRDDVARSPEWMFEPRFSALTVKSEFYHPVVVKLLQGCVGPERTGWDNARECLRTQAEQTVRTSSGEILAKRNLNWTAPTPAIQPWSGVRERPYAIGPDFAFAGAGTTSPDGLEPFDFIYQLAFTSPPYAGMTEIWDQIAGDIDWDDKTPWQFDESILETGKNVNAYLKQHGDRYAILADMRQFVWLQRLFRAALGKKLGEQFPFESLVALARETAPSVNRQRTLRWNPNFPPEIKLVAGMIDGYETLSGPGQDAVKACLALVGVSAGKVRRQDLDRTLSDVRDRLYTVSDEDWAQSCVIPEATDPQLNVISAHTNDLRKLRHAMGLRADETLLIKGGASCGPL